MRGFGLGPAFPNFTRWNLRVGKGLVWQPASAWKIGQIKVGQPTPHKVDPKSELAALCEQCSSEGCEKLVHPRSGFTICAECWKEAKDAKPKRKAAKVPPAVSGPGMLVTVLQCNFGEAKVRRPFSHFIPNKNAAELLDVLKKLSAPAASLSLQVVPQVDLTTEGACVCICV